MLEPASGTGVDPVVASRVDVPSPLPREMTQIVHLVTEMTRHREVGQVGSDQAEIECETTTQLGASRHRSRIASETLHHLHRVLQVALVGGRSEAVGSGKGAPAPDSSQHLGEICVAPIVIVRLIGGHRGQGQPVRHLPEQIVAWVVLGHPVVPELEMQPGPEQLPQPRGLPDGGPEIIACRRLGHCSGMTPGEDVDVVTLRRMGEVLPEVDRVVLLPPKLGSRHQIGETPITVGRAGEQDQMVCLGQIRRLRPMRADTSPPTQPPLPTLGSGVPMPVPFLGCGHRVVRSARAGLEPDLDSVDGGKPGLLGRLPEPGDPVEPMVVGDCQRLVTELDGPLHQILGMGGSIEEGEVGVTVQFGIPVHPPHYIEHMFGW